MSQDLIQLATTNIQDILEYSLKITSENKVVIIYDTEYPLTNILVQGYRNAIENLNIDADFYDFADISKHGKEYAIEIFNQLKRKDLVVLIQSSSFRLDDFRIRLSLFNIGLKVIEHMHLYRNDKSVFDVYINSLKYDESEREWYRLGSENLLKGLSVSQKLEIRYQDSKLESLALEIPKLNIGDYTGMDNIGGTFPIGEIFTESKDFESMNGSVYIYGFADRSFNISFYEPFRVDIENGLIAGYGENTPQEFIEVVNLIKEYERPLIREIGFGLNRAITRDRPLGDITAYERILGVHFSLGEKHSVYKKAGITTHKTKFHVDLFLCVDQVNLQVDNQEVCIMDQNGYKFN